MPRCYRRRIRAPYRQRVWSSSKFHSRSSYHKRIVKTSRRIIAHIAHADTNATVFSAKYSWALTAWRRRAEATWSWCDEVSSTRVHHGTRRRASLVVSLLCRRMTNAILLLSSTLFNARPVIIVLHATKKQHLIEWKWCFGFGFVEDFGE